MRAVTRVTFLDDEGEKFFGEGPCRLLRAVEQTGSLRAAAASMGMAYTKALKLLRRAEAALGCPLTARAAGGRDGGGSCLTAEGRAWLEGYERCRDACAEAGARLCPACLGRQTGPLGCVIMASGAGRRFGGEKVTAPFRGRPMLACALEATEGLFARRVVVTRSEKAAALCAGYPDVQVVLHSLPDRSDTIRLGLAAVGPAAGCLFCPADQPLLRRQTVAALAEGARREPAAVWRAAWQGAAGAPVLFPAWCFGQLAALGPGEGGRALLSRLAAPVRLVEASCAEELADADTPAELKRLEKCDL